MLRPQRLRYWQVEVDHGRPARAGFAEEFAVAVPIELGGGAGRLVEADGAAQVFAGARDRVFAAFDGDAATIEARACHSAEVRRAFGEARDCVLALRLQAIVGGSGSSRRRAHAEPWKVAKVEHAYVFSRRRGEASPQRHSGSRPGQERIHRRHMSKILALPPTFPGMLHFRRMKLDKRFTATLQQSPVENALSNFSVSAFQFSAFEESVTPWTP